MLEALIGFAAFLALAFLRVPMAFAMGIVGFVGVGYKLNFHVASAMIAPDAAKVACTASGPTSEGPTCVVATRSRLAPLARAASTYSSERATIVEARARR